MRYLFAVLLLLSTPLVANEGMWMPDQMSELGDELSRLGFEGDAAALESLTSYPLGAVVWLGGCTASFVSPQGLIATNHHCARGSIQYNSTEDSNLLDDGFLAQKLSDELPAAPGSRVYMTVAYEDVTTKIQEAIPGEARGRERWKAIQDQEKGLIAKCEQKPGYRCRVKAFYGGGLYLLLEQLEIRDVRLVYAPAGSVGVFGGDIDNWMWPRHTGDFAFLRAYVGPDGKPADFSPENVPLKPPFWLRIAPEGLDVGDFAMVTGFPGSTKRHCLADEVKNAFGWYYPARIAAYQEALAIVDRETAGREAAAIAYATTVAGLNNGLKNNQGMLAGLAESGLYRHKKKVETALRRWIDDDPVRLGRWGSAIDELRQLEASKRLTQERYLVNSMLNRRTLLGSARKIARLAHESTKPDAQREPGYQQRDHAKIRSSLIRVERRFDAQVDRALLRHFLLQAAALPAEQRIAGLDDYFGLQSQPLDEKALDLKLETLYGRTRLVALEDRLALMEATPDSLAASDDPFLVLALALLPGDLAADDEHDRLAGEETLVRPRYMEALTAYLSSQGHPLYPDANSTLRITFGKVKGYAPRDAVVYRSFTSARGILEKNTGEEPFDSPPDLLDAVKNRAFGTYQESEGKDLPVNFLATLDITGGNSGSPVLNQKGELVGLAFDGNWESMVSDWVFLPKVTRTIAVDVRYMLWVMDRIDGAHNLLKEMGLGPQFQP